MIKYSYDNFDELVKSPI